MYRVINYNRLFNFFSYSDLATDHQPRDHNNVYVLTRHYGIPCLSTQIFYAYKNPVFILVSEAQSRRYLST